MAYLQPRKFAAKNAMETKVESFAFSRVESHARESRHPERAAAAAAAELHSEERGKRKTTVTGHSR
jgi:hypothetical protein